MKLRITFLFCAVMFYSAQMWGQTYNPGDIAVINAIINNNGLQWTKANPADGSYVPADWTGVTWSDDAENKRIITLNVVSRLLSGALDVSGLTNLQYLNCGVNKLTSLDVSGLTNLQQLYCYGNNLTVLNLTGLNSITSFNGDGQTSSLSFTGSAGNYTANATFGADATFDNAALSYSSGVLTSASNAATFSGFTSPTGLPDFNLTGTLTMTYPAGSAIGEVELQAETFACLNNGTLYIQSPLAETVQVYSVGGVSLYNFQKPSGAANYPVNQPKGMVLIVKGSSGWVRKIVVSD